MPNINFEGMGEYAVLLKRLEQARKNTATLMSAEKFSESILNLEAIHAEIKEWLFDHVIVKRDVHLYFD